MSKDPALPGEQWCYRMARCWLQQGRRDRALVMTGELLQSETGRPFGRRLLAEIYGTTVPLAQADTLECATAPAPAAGFLRKV